MLETTPLDVGVGRGVSLGKIVSSQSESNYYLWPMKLKKLCSS